MAYTTINKGGTYFNTKLYTGNGGTNALTGVGFQPDLTWIKERGATGDHFWCDAVRGVTKYILSNATGAEGTNANTLTAFGTDGFTLGSDGWTNNNSDTYASWNWLGANGTASNSNGSITSTVSANTTAGFSIVSYTGTGSAGATVGHGLGATPAMIIVKNRSAAWNWSVYHKDAFTSQAAPGVLYLNTTAGKANDVNVWGNSSVTINSTVFSLGDYEGTNLDGGNLIAYCFAQKQGYSKFGSYTGNASADGVFIHTGFKPAFVIVKRTSDTQSWVLWDNKRPGYNQTNPSLTPNETGAEETRSVDFLSNGFKNRQNNTATNAASTYIYMAFAEFPFTSSTGTPVTAR